MRKATLKGKVFSGGGTGSLFVNLPWARRQFIRKLKFNPYPGTLNLKVASRKEIEALRNAKKCMKIEAPKGFYGGRCFEALVGGKVRGAVVVPDVPGYPSDVLEILAPVSLREELELEDGMKLTVTVWLK